MNCNCSEETIALFVEDDLSLAPTNDIKTHLSDCGKCREVYERLQKSQAFLKSRLRPGNRESISRQTLAEVRHGVLSMIEDSPRSMGWSLRIERALWLGYRKNGFALASLAALVVVSAVFLMESHRSTQAASPVAVFDSANNLLRPDGYREWMFLGSSVGKHPTAVAESSTGSAEPFGNVYISRSAYKEYAQTGKFPEGTVLVLELAKAGSTTVAGVRTSYEDGFSALEVSVKDSARFEGGWSFFDFSGGNGVTLNKTQALPEASGCRSCHRTCADTDEVFTQFYPILRTTRV
jgi:hypothetical protein